VEVLEAIKSRRSIRKYQDTPVDDKTVEVVLEAARWAPSWSNTQCWRFVVVRDSKTKGELADVLIAPNPSVENATNPASGAIRSAPVVIIACAELLKSGYRRDTGEPATDKGHYWYMFDVALAMQNLALAAHSLGLGTVCVGLFDAKRVASILKIPEGSCPVAMTPLGYPAQEGKAPPRKELSAIVFHEKFGSPGETQS